MIDATLQAQVAARRQQRTAKLSEKFILPIPGYADLLAARYRVLTFDDKDPILERQEKDEDGVPVDKVGASVDMLVNACVELLQVTGPDQYQSIGNAWTSAAIGEIFGIEAAPTVRQALRDALTSDGVMDHFNAYIDKVNKIKAESEGVAVGEPAPSEEGSQTSDSGQE